MIKYFVPECVKKSIAVMCLLIAVVSCVESERDRAVSAVRQYHEKLVETYAKANLEPIEEVATPDAMNRIFPVIQALINSNSVMIARQEVFTVKAADARGSKAQIDTEEKWRYWWQDRKTAEITKPESTMVYSLRYSLVKSEGRWKVDAIASLE